MLISFSLCSPNYAVGRDLVGSTCSCVARNPGSYSQQIPLQDGISFRNLVVVRSCLQSCRSRIAACHRCLIAMEKAGIAPCFYPHTLRFSLVDCNQVLCSIFAREKNDMTIAYMRNMGNYAYECFRPISFFLKRLGTSLYIGRTAKIVAKVIITFTGVVCVM